MNGNIAVFFSSMLAVLVSAASPVLAAGLADRFAAHASGSHRTVDHSAWDALLKKYIRRDADSLNRVDYSRFKAESHGELKRYVKSLEAVDVKLLDRPEQFAFWANLYNAKTIDVVLDHYPVASIRKIVIKEGLFGFLKKSVGFGGPWKAKIINVSGQALSLDDIEHGILRPIFKDPRVHYAVNCASIGCPNLRRNAFTAANLETELEAGARDYVNTPRGASIDGDSVRVSSIYSWFQADFGGNDAGVLAHLRKYAAPALKARLKGVTSISGHGYDWALNDASKD